ncbi:MAG: hypothetical protein ACE5EQ_06250 [Phycisphaerae bacterium]
MPDRIDQFESLFKSADKPGLAYNRLKVGSVLLVTDSEQPETDRLLARVRGFLAQLENDNPTWASVPGDSYKTVDDLQRIVEEHGPDLIVTYRHLHDADRRPRFSLGVFLDELTQNAPAPVLVLPSGDDGRPLDPPVNTDSVMVVTDHLTGDNRLVEYGARLTEAGGKLILAHIEDDVAFARILSEIGKIPEIETDLARRLLREQLLNEPRDYIESCARVLHDAGLSIQIEPVVAFGHCLKDYQRLLGKHAVDLLVLHTRKESQLAMGGMAYLITAEFRGTPLLLL